MKTEILKGFVFILIGAWLGVRFMPEPELPEVKVTQQQAAKCKAVVRKEIKPDGTKTEEVVFESDVSQKQEILDSKPKEKKHSAIILKDQLSYSYKYIETDLFTLSPLVQVRTDKSAHIGVKIDF